MDASPALHPTDQTLQSYGLGKLDDRSARVINRHLEGCADCRQRVGAVSSDTFLGRLLEARKPSSESTSGRSLVDGSLSFTKANAGESGSSPPPADTLPPGLANHADYEIKKELGRGGMGVVYLAHNRMMGRDEVLKVMGRRVMERPGVLERFQREIKSVAKLRHPNIVTAYTAFRLDGDLVFAMEYVEGLDLAKLVKAKGKEGLPIVHAAYFIHQAALGLQHAHEKETVHRDIKPHNLMLTQDGKSRLIKVLDFGLAKATREEKVDSALTSAGQALGTPDYIAPEQILNATDVDIRADLYSLGATFYYLLTGRPPFTANSLYDMYQAHISRDADPLNLIRPEVPAELAALVSKMMAKDPGRRFQTPAEVAEALLPFFRKAAATNRSPIADVARPGPTSAARPDPAPASIPAPVATDTGRPAVRPEKPPVQPVAEARWEELIDLRDTDRSTVAVPVAEPGPPPNRKTRRMALGGSLFGLIALGVIILTIKHQGGEIKITAPDDKAFKVEKDGFVIENQPSLVGSNAGRTDGPPSDPSLPDGKVLREGLPKDGKSLRGAQPDIAGGVAQGWKALFNGKDLSGWTGFAGGREVAPEEIFTVDRSEQAYRPQASGAIATRVAYGDFVFSCEFAVGPNWHSGLWFSPEPINPAKLGGFECMVVGDMEGEEFGSGDIYSAKKGLMIGGKPHVGEGTFHHRTMRPRVSTVSTTWNTYEVQREGPRFSLRINGVEINRVESTWSGPWRIGLKAQGAETVRFRNIRIKELNGEDRSSAPNPVGQSRHQPARVLLITGDNVPVHDWPGTTRKFQEILNDPARYQVDVTKTPAKDLTDENLGKYDVLVLNYKATPRGGPDTKWSEANRRAFLKAIKDGGKGLYVHHYASAAFTKQEWPEFEKAVSGGWWTKSFHGPPHTFNVSKSDSRNPIVEGLPTSFEHVGDELYSNSLLTAGSDVIATAYSDPDKPNGTGKNEPVIWVNQYGKGRVIHNALGHDARAMSGPNFQLSVRRGVDWVAEGGSDLPAVGQPTPTPIPSDAKWIGGKAYKLYAQSLSWHDAEARCRQMGGQLAVVTNETENLALSTMAKEQGLEGVWLGATDERVEGQWVWVDGSAMRYENWNRAARQPNNKQNSEHYLTLLTVDAHNGQWSDQPDVSTQLRLGIACQWDAGPAGGSPGRALKKKTPRK